MRRFFLGMAIASLTAGAPLTAFGGDREIADAIVSALKHKQSDGTLKGFDIDLSVEGGKVVIGGTVASKAQLDSVLQAASNTRGVRVVQCDASVRPASKVSNLVRSNSYVVPASSGDEIPELLTQPTRSIVRREPIVSSADANITSDVLGRLGKAQSAGRLRNFEVDVSTVDREVWAKGFVATPEQKQLILETIQSTPGVRKVIDDVTVTGGVRRASNEVASPSSMPVVGSGAPRAFAPSALTNGSMGSGIGGVAAPMAPMPMQGGPGYGGGTPRYDQPNMPNYAWPSYAPAPNYAAVTYPKQYSASAWPYIGPFYPYPQVPLGWRKVALEWDDGLWYLDFTHKK